MEKDKGKLGTAGNIPADHTQCATCHRLMLKAHVDAEGNCPDCPKPKPQED